MLSDGLTVTDGHVMALRTGNVIKPTSSDPDESLSSPSNRTRNKKVVIEVEQDLSEVIAFHHSKQKVPRHCLSDFQSLDRASRAAVIYCTSITFSAQFGRLIDTTLELMVEVFYPPFISILLITERDGEGGPPLITAEHEASPCNVIYYRKCILILIFTYLHCN